MKYIVRKCSSQDAQQAIKLVKECAQWLSNQGLEHWNNYYTDALVSKKFAEGIVYGIDDETELISIVSLSENAASYYDQTDFDNFADQLAPALYMSMLAVRPDYQNAGIASSLIEYAEEQCRRNGIKYIRLDVIREYKQLNDFYRKRGYQYKHWRFDGADNDSFYEKEL